MSTASDLDVLLDMGFEKARAEIAVKKSGGCKFLPNYPEAVASSPVQSWFPSPVQGALEWLEANQDKPLEEVLAAANTSSDQAADDADEDPAALEPGEEAHSFVCQDCGKKLRSHAQVQFHAEKSGHENFAESTEEIAPLTEEEKKAKLEELRAKLQEKRSNQSVQDRVDQKKNEVCGSFEPPHRRIHRGGLGACSERHTPLFFVDWRGPPSHSARMTLLGILAEASPGNP
jgi:UBX domain-containing protein 1/4